MSSKNFYVYILTNSRNTVTYIGVTSDLVRRVWEHKAHEVDSFSARYNINKLVYYELCDSAEQAIAREKQLKNWHREWKFNLIKSSNKDLQDLYDDI